MCTNLRTVILKLYLDVNCMSELMMADVTNLENFNSFVAACHVGDDRGKVQQVYDDWITTYEEDVSHFEYKGPIETDAILREICPDKSIAILDCGAGTGLVGEKLNASGYTNITALDISQKSLDLAREKGVYKRIICDEVGKKKMPFEENVFDALVCVGCFLPGHMNQDCFPEWLRIVKPGGIILLIMRLEYLTTAAEFKNGQFERAVETFEKAKKWTSISRKIFPNYFKKFDGVAFVYRVL